MTILAAHSWQSNAHLIEDVAALGYIGPQTLDLSYGRGKFWARFRPELLLSNDIDRATEVNHHHDATRHCPLWDDKFDTVVWDGPYRLNGTPDRGDFDARYGISRATTWQDRMAVIVAGARWAALYAKPGGTVLVKCQDQVVSGRKVWQTRLVADAVEQFDAALVDRFDMVRPPRAQPAGRRQVHSRSNVSTLLVFRRNK